MNYEQQGVLELAQTLAIPVIATFVVVWASWAFRRYRDRS